MRRLLERAGFALATKAASDEFWIFEHPDGRVVPVNPHWAEIEPGDPVFKCLQRDLRISAHQLLRRLNEAQQKS